MVSMTPFYWANVNRHSHAASTWPLAGSHWLQYVMHPQCKTPLNHSWWVTPKNIQDLNTSFSVFQDFTYLQRCCYVSVITYWIWPQLSWGQRGWECVPSTSLEINISKLKNFLFFFSFLTCLVFTLSCPVNWWTLVVVLLICVHSLHSVASGLPWR